MLLMNVGFCDKERSWEDGMLEMVVEGTPPMSVPRDTREEALLICEAKQSDPQLLKKKKIWICCFGSEYNKGVFQWQHFCLYSVVGKYLNCNTVLFFTGGRCEIALNRHGLASSIVDRHSWHRVQCTLTLKPALMMLWMRAFIWPWSQPLMLPSVDRALFITSEGAELIWPTVRPTHWLPKDWMVDADTLGNFATSTAVTWKEKRFVGNRHFYRITDCWTDIGFIDWSPPD